MSTTSKILPENEDPPREQRPSPGLADREHGIQRDHESDANFKLPFEGAASADLPFSKQWRIKQANSQDAPFTVGPWTPGVPLQIFCGTWNLAQRDAKADEVSHNFITSNAHIIALTTQENGPYVGTNTAHTKWDVLVGNLLPDYTRIQAVSLWAVHVVIFVRTADVYPHVCEVHFDTVKTGSMGNSLGNKGGVGIAFSLRLKTQPPNRAPEPAGHASGAKNGAASITMSSVMTFLFIGAHLTAHQENHEKRNEDYLHIIKNLRLGSAGIYEQRFVKRMRRAGLVSGVPPVFSVKSPVAAPSLLTASSPPPTPSSSLTGRSYRPLPTRDVTEEFDVCCFFGDLNYRINGTAGAIRHIIRNHVALRAALSNNDQLAKEMAKGIVFHGFEEMPLTFAPTYKLKKVKVDKKKAIEETKQREKEKSDKAVSHRSSVSSPVDGSDPESEEESGKPTTSFYDPTQYQDGPKARMPAYCDRVLLKSNFRTMLANAVKMNLYTDVGRMTTSDHRPVALMATVTTQNRDTAEDDSEPPAASTGCY